MLPRLLVLALCFTACATTAASSDKPATPLAELVEPLEPADPPPITESPRLVIQNATVYTAAGDIFKPGYVSLKDGRILAVGAGSAPGAGGRRYGGWHGPVCHPGLD